MERSSSRTVVLFLVIIDVITINLSSFLALLFQFDLSLHNIPEAYLTAVLRYAPLHTFLTVCVFGIFHLYRRIWRFAGVYELIHIFYACMISSLLQIFGMSLLSFNISKSYFLLDFMIFMVSEMGIRFSCRFYRIFIYRAGNNVGILKKRAANVMVIGAGSAGSVLIQEIRTSRELNKHVVCVIDDSPLKKGRYFYGAPIVGGSSEILKSVKDYRVQEIIIAMPSASRRQIKVVLDICKHASCKLRILPGVYQLINGDVSVSKLRAVEIEDLLGREPVNIELDDIMDYVTDKIIMITGGGGSIGSELCRQITSYRPKRLIIVDIYENNAYDIQQELIRTHPELDLVVIIASVRDERRIDELFKEFHPDIVYHAAAHKHVPLMENSPNEAIKNNVFGTYKTARAAAKYGIARFVLISSDKAVNPTNIMGASKRICEMIIQTLDNHSETEFVAVRFGNVLGSNGSVVPLFKKQIEQGGPVTVTHPDVIRYFMTIPEAVSLVLQAGSYANGGEIFVLDMGEPVKIADLARNLIRLSGYVPDEDIEITYGGLRPGEKLYEELLMDEEGLVETDNKLIYIGNPMDINENLFMQQLKELEIIADSNSEMIYYKVREIVPTYKRTQEEKAGKVSNAEKLAGDICIKDL